MFELARVPVRTPESDYYALIGVYEGIRDLFEQGGDAGGPLAAHVREQVAALRKEAAEYEAQAATTLTTVREHMAAARYGAARHQIDRLGESPLVHTHAAKAAQPEIEREKSAVEAGLVKREIEGLFPGSRVTHRQGNERDVDLAFDLNTPTQGVNLVSGLARFVPLSDDGTVTPGAGSSNWVLRLLPDDEGRLVKDRPLAFENPFEAASEVSIAFQLHLRGHTPFFLGVDVGGVQVGVLSADPELAEKFGPGAIPPPLLLPSKSRVPAEFDFYGRGRGVAFHVTEVRPRGPGLVGFGDPARWKWDEGHQGRHFVGREREARERDPKSPMLHRWFAFERRDRPYRVHVSRGEASGEPYVRLAVDNQEVLRESDPKFRAAPSTGLLQILTYTTCEIDDVLLSGRVDAGWLKRKEAERAKK
jgi:hypothetical protein